MKCRGCGDEFDPDEAAEEFNEYFDDHDYEMNGLYGFCASCAISIIENEEEDEDEVPVGCRACGGDYPNCTTSCPLFD